MLEPPTATPLAPIGSRVVARLIDGLLVLGVGTVLIFVFGDVRLGDRFDVPAWVRITNVVLALVYEVLLIALTGQTVGKRIVGIRVVDGTTGALPEVGPAARRAVPNVLALVPVIGVLAWVLYVRALWHPRRQGWHDALAATIVVRA